MHVSLPTNTVILQPVLTTALPAAQVQLTPAVIDSTVVPALLAGAAKNGTAHLPMPLLISKMARTHRSQETKGLAEQATMWFEHSQEFYDELARLAIKPGSKEFIEADALYGKVFDAPRLIPALSNVITALTRTRLESALAAKYPGLEAEIERVALTPHPDERHTLIIDKLAAGEGLKCLDGKNANEAYQRYVLMSALLAKYNLTPEEKHQVLVHRYATRVRTMLGSALKFSLELLKDPTRIINLLKTAWIEIRADKTASDQYKLHLVKPEVVSQPRITNAPLVAV